MNEAILNKNGLNVNLSIDGNLIEEKTSLKTGTWIAIDQIINIIKI